MIDLSLMSKQEKIIILSLLILIMITVGIMFTPAKVRNERKVSAEPQNILETGGAPGADRGFFNTPKDIAVDKSGEIYVVDTKNHRIQKFNAAGNFILAWGKEGDGPGDFKEPCGIDIGPNGNIYVADTWNGRVQVFSNTGSYLMEIGRDRGLWGPRDVGVDKEGNIYILDTGWCKIEKFDSKGRYLATFGKKRKGSDEPGGKGPVEFWEPFSIKQGPDNNLYILDRRNYRVQVLTTEGKFVREFKVRGWNDAQIVEGCLMEPYIDIDFKNRLIFITDSAKHRVIRYNLNGTGEKFLDQDIHGVKFICPVGVAVLPNEKVLVTDHSMGKILTLKQ